MTQFAIKHVVNNTKLYYVSNDQTALQQARQYAERLSRAYLTEDFDTDDENVALMQLGVDVYNSDFDEIPKDLVYIDIKVF